MSPQFFVFLFFNDIYEHLTKTTANFILFLIFLFMFLLYIRYMLIKYFFNYMFLFIAMVDHAGDDPVDRKPSVVDYFVKIKLPKVEASVKVEAPIKVEASVKVEAPIKVEALSVNSGVSNLRDNEVDTTYFFSSRETWKDKDGLLGWVC